MKQQLDTFLLKKPAFGKGVYIAQRAVVLGSPGKVVRELSPQERAKLKTLADKYLRVAAYYLERKINVPALLGA